MSWRRRDCLLAGLAAGGLLAVDGLGIARPRALELRLPDPLPPAGRTISLEHHLAARLGWGPSPEDRRELARLGAQAWLAQQLDPERQDGWSVRWALRGATTITLQPPALYEFDPQVLAQDLASAQVQRAATSRRPVFERLAGFWADHFSIDLGKDACRWLLPDHLEQAIRPHVLGSFASMLRAVLTSPAMLWYLDGQRNRAGPGQIANENHARELLELHTLGIDGGYSQQDVAMVARCLSGWSLGPRAHGAPGLVHFDPQSHDQGAKRVLGQELPASGGAQDLDRLVALLVAHPATAHHLARKLCATFISDEPPPAAVAAVADRFRSSHGDLAACLRTLVAREELRGEGRWAPVRGAKLRTPQGYQFAALRMLGCTSDGGAALSTYLVALGQAPYRCPTPDGYGEKPQRWRDGLWWRWRFAADLAAGRIPGTSCDAPALCRDLGGVSGVLGHRWGRQPSPQEAGAATGLDPQQLIAFGLAAPGFQYC